MRTTAQLVSTRSEPPAEPSNTHGPQAPTTDPVLLGAQIIRDESTALAELADRLNGSFLNAIELMERCEGCVIITGMGKAGLIGQKIAATLASTGTPSHFVHPAEALHGDLGRIRPNDVVFAFSYSGETEEVVQLAQAVTRRAVSVVAVTGRQHSSLASCAEATIHIGTMHEAGDLRLAPSTSTTAMLALGDALALVISHRRGFAADDFARYHPGGSLGKKLMHVQDCMRGLNQCRLANHATIARDVLVQAGTPGRRTGAVMLVNDDGVLVGIFTDSDLARLVENRREASLDLPICQIMTSSPTTITQGSQLEDAIDVMVSRKLSELPVTDDRGAPIGIIDVTDIISLLPAEDDEPSENATVGPLGELPDTLPFRQP